MSDPPDPRVDELRQQLRSLGYLDAGVDRFVLAPARGTRGPLALAALASLRVGILAGVLLGPAAAIGVGARLPGLIDGVRDALVIAAYLVLLFGIAGAALSFGLTAVSVAIFRAKTFPPAHQTFDRLPDRPTRRPSNEAIDEWRAILLGRLSRNAGMILTIISLGYVTLWWRNANAGFGWSAPVWTAFALLVAVAISLLLGHAQRITTLAVLAAASPAALLPAITNRSWRVVLAGGALAFAGAAGLLVSTASADVALPSTRAPLTVLSSGRTFRVIAIDGFDPAMYDTFVAAGPDVTAVRHPLAPQDTSDPARAWTTIATGVPPDVHGVLDMETRRIAGVQGSVAATSGRIRETVAAATDLLRLTKPSIASRNERRSMTFWEVAEEAGLRTAVVNWWATWPAPPDGTGIVVTDRAVLRLEHGGALDGEIAPAPLYAELQIAWPALRERARELARTAFADISDETIALVLRRSAELDATIIGILQALPGPPRDLDVLYLPGLDIAQHTLLAPSDSGASSPSAVSARVDALRAYYAFLRQALDPLIVPSARTQVVIIAQPGRVDQAAAGVLAIYATLIPHARAGVTLEAEARVVDIAATVLNHLGVPLSRELAGQPLPGALPVSPPRYLDTYGRPFAAPSSHAGKPLDQEMIDRLRSLGYVK